MVIALPEQADAFWPFWESADAASFGAVADSYSPKYYLAAATNLDPNPYKGLGAGIETSGDIALLAHSGPAGTIADISSSAPQTDRISTYIVRNGDTISEIAGMFGVSASTIIWANNLSGAKDIHPGDTLVILPISGIQHTTVKGDTLRSLAKKYSADATEIAQFNGLDSEEPLAVGTNLIIPGGEIAPIRRLTSDSEIYEPYLGGGGAIRNGYYSNPIPGAILTQRVHGWNAIDLGALRGTPIRASADGTVIITRNNGAWNGGYGNYVVISHGNGTQTLYAHMTRAAVSARQTVSAGQIIGYTGSTGQSTGSHLHFEVRGAANPLRNCRIGTTCVAQ